MDSPDPLAERYSDLSDADLLLFASDPSVPPSAIVGRSLDLDVLRAAGFTVTEFAIHGPPHPGPQR